MFSTLVSPTVCRVIYFYCGVAVFFIMFTGTVCFNVHVLLTIRDLKMLGKSDIKRENPKNKKYFSILYSLTMLLDNIVKEYMFTSY